MSLPPNDRGDADTSFTRRQAYLDQVRLPGQIVDADLISIAPLPSTPSYNAGAGSFDLCSGPRGRSLGPEP